MAAYFYQGGSYAMPMPRMSPKEWREITGLPVPDDYGENWHRPDGEHMLDILALLPADFLSDEAWAIAQNWMLRRRSWYQELAQRMSGAVDPLSELGDLDVTKNGASPAT